MFFFKNFIFISTEVERASDVKCVCVFATFSGSVCFVNFSINTDVQCKIRTYNVKYRRTT